LKVDTSPKARTLPGRQGRSVAQNTEFRPENSLYRWREGPFSMVVEPCRLIDGSHDALIDNRWGAQ